MSVLIKDMKMPKSCWNCPLKQINGMDIVCDVVREKFSIADDNIIRCRLGRCPLVPVPPHGRLIDADASIDVAEGHVSPGQTTISAFLLNHIEGLIPRVVIPAEEK